MVNCSFRQVSVSFPSALVNSWVWQPGSSGRGGGEPALPSSTTWDRALSQLGFAESPKQQGLCGPGYAAGHVWAPAPGLSLFVQVAQQRGCYLSVTVLSLYAVDK